ncbi:hypothetical protein [Hyalangium rubrum]|uniref:Uncharacterized protein n=1 Tax=Hyalangium rubrum TaxID=3103134 RepID=A0ABU5HG68_9BACT|nr:hypothetical protein [Hyalangium sp. s54d21]MDY7232147.1 hypothetical protein [Hyalangium sp. s54d21]
MSESGSSSPSSTSSWGRPLSTEEEARQLLVEFRARLRDVSAVTAGHVELRNLRARVEGVLNVAQDWWKAKAEEKSPPSRHA